MGPLGNSKVIKGGSTRLVLFFAALTIFVTWLVILTWEKVLLRPVFSYMEAHYSMPDPKQRAKYEQRVEHFFISTVVDVVVVSLLLRIVGRQQHKLVASEERYRALFTHANDGIGVLTASDHCLLEVNGRFAEILRAPPQQLIGKTLHDLRWDGNTDGRAGAPSVDALLRQSDAGELEMSVKTAERAERPVLVSFSSLTTGAERLIILIVRDLSEQKKLAAEKEAMQLQLFQASKLASIGELSAGVAHEINNPLNGIINFAQLLKDDGVARSEFDARLIDGIIDEGLRITRIVSDLLTFARHETQELRPVNVAEVVETSVSLFGHQLDKDGIALEVEVADDLPRVLGDGSRLRQVVVNMISNAHHALRASDSQEKVFRIKVGGATTAAGRRVARMEFFDNGVGIRREDLGKIFDPFFTTRRDSGGTGLGLSLSFGIIAELGGTISAESEEGRFARFVVELPGTAA
ncbi:MAG TPA: ATP-binding protein [Pyrinomonadaceae bacterium]|jgi:PAS domain S-box-containing protein|nr:ATP-binding protein [Pyrinomonadaceae bacterium]